jgi:hypothetical protein
MYRRRREKHKSELFDILLVVSKQHFDRHMKEWGLNTELFRYLIDMFVAMERRKMPMFRSQLLLNRCLNYPDCPGPPTNPCI